MWDFFPHYTRFSLPQLANISTIPSKAIQELHNPIYQKCLRHIKILFQIISMCVENGKAKGKG